MEKEQEKLAQIHLNPSQPTQSLAISILTGSGVLQTDSSQQQPESLQKQSVGIQVDQLNIIQILKQKDQQISDLQQELQKAKFQITSLTVPFQKPVPTNFELNQTTFDGYSHTVITSKKQQIPQSQLQSKQQNQVLSQTVPHLSAQIQQNYDKPFLVQSKHLFQPSQSPIQQEKQDKEIESFLQDPLIKSDLLWDSNTGEQELSTKNIIKKPQIPKPRLVKRKPPRPPQTQKEVVLAPKPPVPRFSRRPLSNIRKKGMVYSNSRNPRRKSCIGPRKKKVLDEILFSQQDSQLWESIVSNIKQDPKLMKKLIRKNTPQNFTRDISNLELPKVDRSFQNNRASFKQGRRFSQNPARKKKFPQIFDWSNSILDQYSTQEEPSSDIITSNTIQHSLKALEQNWLSSKQMKDLHQRVNSSITTICKELNINEEIQAGFSKNDLQDGLKRCGKLVRSRALTLKVLKLIHDREDAILELMSMNGDEPNLRPMYDQIVGVSQELQQTLAYWKHCGLPYKAFIYLGEDYTNKVLDDNRRIANLFENLRQPSLYED